MVDETNVIVFLLVFQYIHIEIDWFPIKCKSFFIFYDSKVDIVLQELF